MLLKPYHQATQNMLHTCCGNIAVHSTLSPILPFGPHKTTGRVGSYNSPYTDVETEGPEVRSWCRSSQLLALGARTAAATSCKVNLHCHWLSRVFSKQPSRACSLPGTVCGTGDTAGNKREKVVVPSICEWMGDRQHTMMCSALGRRARKKDEEGRGTKGGTHGRECRCYCKQCDPLCPSSLRFLSIEILLC